jgi:acetolactate synthase-1/2/3 large subunit
LQGSTRFLAGGRVIEAVVVVAGVGANPGRTALDMMDLGNPDLNWVSIANGMGVEAAQATDMESFNALFATANTRQGPFVIELVI